MNTREAIASTIQIGDVVCNAYLNDFDDGDLMMRPHADCNHVNWQIGHLISADHEMVNGCLGETIVDLPEGFVDKYSKENRISDDPTAFCSKAELLELMKSVHDSILEKLKTLGDEDLDQPAPEEMRSYAPTVGAVFNMIGAHWLMHCGQWVIVRRQLGKEIVI